MRRIKQVLWITGYLITMPIAMGCIWALSVTFHDAMGINFIHWIEAFGIVSACILCILTIRWAFITPWSEIKSSRMKIIDRIIRRRRKKAIRWLLDPQNRRQGRSTLLAEVYIDLALANPGLPIIPRDHHPFRNADRHLMQIIQNIGGPKFRYSPESFVCPWPSVAAHKEVI